jgi:hypothetical protein
MLKQKWFEFKALKEYCQTWHKGLFEIDTLNKLKSSKSIK